MEFLYRNRKTGDEQWIPYATSRWNFDWDLWRLVYRDGTTPPRLTLTEHLSWIQEKGEKDRTPCSRSSPLSPPVLGPLPPSP